MRAILVIVALSLASAASAADGQSPGEAAPSTVPPAAAPSTPPPTPSPATAPSVPPAPVDRSAAGRTPKTSELIRFVPSGEDMNIAFHAPVNVDCSSAGKVFTRLVTRPEHGTLSFVYRPGFASFPPGPREHCNAAPVPGVETMYRSAPDFLGEDTADVLYLYPGGFAETVHFIIEVR